MKMLITHPANKQFVSQLQLAAGLNSEVLWMEVRYDSCMPRFGPCKRISLPDGRIIDRESFSWRCGPVTYGLEDLTWLMWSKVIKEQFEPLFYIVEEKPLRMFSMFSSFCPFVNERYKLVLSSGV